MKSVMRVWIEGTVLILRTLRTVMPVWPLRTVRTVRTKMTLIIERTLADPCPYRPVGCAVRGGKLSEWKESTCNSFSTVQ